MVNTQPALSDELASRVARVFGSPTDPMSLVEKRAHELLPQHNPVVWEGDAQTFQFSYIGKAAESVLGTHRGDGRQSLHSGATL